MALLPFAADDRRDGVVGLAFAVRQVAQLLLMCDHHDIGISIDLEKGSGVISVSKQGSGVSSGSHLPEITPDPFSAADTSPRVFIYDNYPGGIGFSEPLSRMHRELLDRTRALIADCDC